MAKDDGGSVWAGSAIDGLQLPVPPDYRPAFNDDAGWELLLHSDVFEWLTDPATDGALRKRVYFVLREMLVSGQSGRVKSVRGAGKGWLRTPLGGSGGFHYYLWWAPHSSSAVDGAGLEDRQILVRRVRHHDETNLGLDPGVLDDWIPITLEEVLQPEGDSPFTEQQMAIATHGDKPVTIVKGTPGSGQDDGAVAGRIVLQRPTVPLHHLQPRARSDGNGLLPGIRPRRVASQRPHL